MKTFLITLLLALSTTSLYWEQPKPRCCCRRQNKQIAHLKIANNKLVDRNRALVSQNKALTNENNSLKNRVAILNKNIRNLNNTIVSLKAQLSKCRRHHHHGHYHGYQNGYQNGYGYPIVGDNAEEQE